MLPGHQRSKGKGNELYTRDQFKLFLVDQIGGVPLVTVSCREFDIKSFFVSLETSKKVEFGLFKFSRALGHSDA